MGEDMWTEEERAALMRVWHDVDVLETRVYAIATRAVEIVSARGGTMTADVLRESLALVGGPSPTCGGLPNTAAALRQHIAAKGARIATLEARLREARDDSRVGLTFWHGNACSMAGGPYPGDPAECEDPACRAWANRLGSPACPVCEMPGGEHKMSCRPEEREAARK